MSTENTKGCWKDLHSSRDHKGFFGVLFGKGNKTGLEGKKIYLQKDSSNEGCVVITTRKKVTKTDSYYCEQL